MARVARVIVGVSPVPASAGGRDEGNAADAEFGACRITMELAFLGRDGVVIIMTPPAGDDGGVDDDNDGEGDDSDDVVHNDVRGRE